MSTLIQVMEMPITWHLIVAALVTAALVATYRIEQGESK